MLMIVVGVLVLLQSLRGSSRPDAPTDGPTGTAQ